MPAIQIEPDQLLQAALQMSRPEVEQFMRKLFALKAREETPNLSAAETVLLLKINRDLPADERQRLNALIARRQAHALTQAELAELMQLTDKAEALGNERLACLIELAALRGVTVEEVMRQHGIHPVPHD